MNETCRKYEASDKAFKKFELTFCTLSVLFVTFLVTLGIVLKNFFRFPSSWTEEFYRCIMVWVTCIDDIISAKEHEHANVDIICSMLPQKLHSYYRMILAVITAVFLIASTCFPYLEVVSMKAAARTSVTMPWFQMWWMYLGTMMGYGLMTLGCFKTISILSKEGKIKVGVDTKDQGLSKLETM